MVWNLVLGYLLIGLFFVFVGPAATDVRTEVRRGGLNPQAKIWQKAAFIVLIGAGIVLAWPVLVPSAWRDQKRSNLFTELESLNEALSQTNEQAIDADEFPNGVGPFGCLSNPIPCRSVLDSKRYLNRLIAEDWSAVSYERIGSFDSEVSPVPVDGYLLKVEEQEIATVFISPYELRNSRKAPGRLRFLEIVGYS